MQKIRDGQEIATSLLSDVNFLEQWNKLLQEGQNQLDSESYHQLLQTLLKSIVLLKKVGPETVSLRYESDILPLLNFAKRLDEIAESKEFRVFLSCEVLQTLRSWASEHFSKDLNTPKKIVTYCATYLNNEDEGPIRRPPLFEHRAESFQELIDFTNAKPYSVLNNLRKDYLKYLKKTPELYDPAALVYIVLHYWQILRASKRAHYAHSDIQCLLQLGEEVLVQSQQAAASSKLRGELQRLVLHLHILLNDHPLIERIDFFEFPQGGFAQSLKKNISDSITNLASAKSTSLFKNFKSTLEASRAVFKNNGTVIHDQQSLHSQSIISLLNEMLTAAGAVLGSAPTGIEICVMGSTARYDRRPNSDIELMILHSEPPDELSKTEKALWQAHVDAYIYHLMTLLELMVMRLGEAPLPPENNGGFRIDQSSHPLLNKIWGTPEDLAKRFVTELEVDGKAFKHPWLHPELTAMLDPLTLYCQHSALNELTQKYQDICTDYLDKKITEADKVTVLSRELNINNALCYQYLTRRQGIAISVLWEILNKADNEMKKMGSIVNIKNLYYKPLANLALSLKLYYKLPERRPYDIFEAMKQNYGFGGKVLFSLLQSALNLISEQQVRLHNKNLKGHQEEEMLFERAGDNINESDKLFWSNVELIQKGIITPLRQTMQDWMDRPSLEFPLIQERFNQESILAYLRFGVKEVGISTEQQIVLSNLVISVIKSLDKLSSNSISLEISESSLRFMSKNHDAQVIKNVIELILSPLSNYAGHSEEQNGFLMIPDRPSEPLLEVNLDLERLQKLASLLMSLKCQESVFTRILNYFLNHHAIERSEKRELAYHWYKICQNIGLANQSMLMASDPAGFRVKERVLAERLDEGIRALIKVPNESGEHESDEQLTNLPIVKVTRATSLDKEIFELDPRVVRAIINTKTGHIVTNKKITISKDAFKHRAVNFIDRCQIPLHFKEHPDRPLMAVFSHLLHMRMFGRGSTPVESVLFEVTLLNNQTIYYPVLISLTVPGATLEEKLEHLPKFNLHDLAANFIMDAIKHTGDGFPRNYVVTGQDPQCEVVCVDSEQIFVNSESEAGILSRRKIQEVSILYCLPLFRANGELAHTLPAETLKILSNINIELVLNECLESLDAREKQDLIVYGDSLQSFIDRGEDKFVGEALFEEGMIGKLALDLRLLKESAKKGVVSGFDVLTICAGRTCAQQYFSETGLRPAAHLKSIAGRIISQSSSNLEKQCLGSSTSFKELRSRKYTPLEAKREIDSYQVSFFNEKQDVEAEFFYDYTDGLTLVINFSGKDSTDKHQLARLIRANISYTQLIIKNCRSLNDQQLRSLLKNSGDTLRLLNISSHPMITEKSLEYLKGFPKLEVLLANETGVKNIRTFFQHSFKIFQLNSCHQLSSLNISAENLVYFDCKNNSILNEFTLNSPQLVKLNLQNNTKLSKATLNVTSEFSIKTSGIFKECLFSISYQGEKRAEHVSSIKKTFTIGDKEELTFDQISLQNIKSCKVVLLGRTSGKTEICKRFTTGVFSGEHELTIGVEFYKKIVRVGPKSRALAIWDTAGVESFRSITRNYYRGGEGFVLVFDLTRRLEDSHLASWADDVMHIIGTASSKPFIFVGTKSDVLERVVSPEEAESIAARYGAVYIECSAKTGENVNAVFDVLVELAELIIYNEEMFLAYSVDNYIDSLKISSTSNIYKCISHLSHWNSMIRMHAVSVIESQGKLNSNFFVQACVKNLDCSDPRVRSDMIAILNRIGKINDPDIYSKAVTAICKTLAAHNINLVRSAVLMLEKINALQSEEVFQISTRNFFIDDEFSEEFESILKKIQRFNSTDIFKKCLSYLEAYSYGYKKKKKVVISFLVRNDMLDSIGVLEACLKPFQDGHFCEDNFLLLKKMDKLDSLDLIQIILKSVKTNITIEKEIESFLDEAAKHHRIGGYFHNRGNERFVCKKYDEAIAYYEEARQLDPNNAEIYCDIGSTMEFLNRDEEAIEYYGKAIELDPKYSTAFNNRGFSKKKIGQYDSAMADYDEALRINPRNEEALRNREALKSKLANLGQSLEAEKNSTQSGTLAFTQHAHSDVINASELVPQFQSPVFSKPASPRPNDSDTSDDTKKRPALDHHPSTNQTIL